MGPVVGSVEVGGVVTENGESPYSAGIRDNSINTSYVLCDLTYKPQNNTPYTRYTLKYNMHSNVHTYKVCEDGEGPFHK